MRRQKPNERVIVFFTAMQSLFSKLHQPLSELEKINTIRRNLLPEYGQRLNPNDLLSLNSLLQSCKWTESCIQITHPQSSEQTITFQNNKKSEPYIPPFPFDNTRINTI